MKHLSTFRLFERLDNSTLVTIEQLLERIGIPNHMRPQITSWWNENRSEIRIHFFRFNTTEPIGGIITDGNTIVLNDDLHIRPMPPHIKLFLALHESRHCDQHRMGNSITQYFDSVVRNDRQSFMRHYQELESDANDFAISSMRACGFDRQMNFEERMLRANEMAGDMVYQMMSADIQRINPVDFFDLLKKQIGV
jgi:hypothetical protein